MYSTNRTVLYTVQCTGLIMLLRKLLTTTYSKQPRGLQPPLPLLPLPPLPPLVVTPPLATCSVSSQSAGIPRQMEMHPQVCCSLNCLRMLALELVSNACVCVRTLCLWGVCGWHRKEVVSEKKTVLSIIMYCIMEVSEKNTVLSIILYCIMEVSEKKTVLSIIMYCIMEVSEKKTVLSIIIVLYYGGIRKENCAKYHIVLYYGGLLCVEGCTHY